MKNYVSRENFKSKLSKKLRLLKQHHGRQQLTGLNLAQDIRSAEKEMRMLLKN